MTDIRIFTRADGGKGTVFRRGVRARIIAAHRRAQDTVDAAVSLHEQCVGATDEWYTPQYVFDALGCQFTMDVAPIGGTGGLEREWIGFVWMNPPFGGRNGIVPWLDKFIAHGDGICLVPDRTSAPWWQDWVVRMDLVLFVSPKIKFISSSGVPGPSPAQGTCLGAMGERGVEALQRATQLGVLMRNA